jgi:anti-sigma B factor antagonist
VKVNERIRHNIVIIDPKGRLTLETEAVFAEVVDKRLQAGCANLVLDLERVAYIDSAGIGSIVRAYCSAQRQGGRLVLLHVTGKNKQVLGITKLLTVFDVYDTEAEAERSFTRSQGAVA